MHLSLNQDIRSMCLNIRLWG